MTVRFIAAYDLENAKLCVDATRALAAVHHELEVPATFFLLGRTLDARADELRPILDNGLFDLQSHTYDHLLLKESRMHGPGCSLEACIEEIRRGKDAVERIFNRPCTGVRSGCGFTNGLQGLPDRLAKFREHGITWISSDLRGPSDSIPAGLRQPYTYAADGHEDLWELPGHSWHDNVLTCLGDYGLVLPWPLAYPWGIPERAPQTAREQADVYRVWMERAFEERCRYFSPIWHPWAQYAFDSEVRAVRYALEYARQLGMSFSTYSDEYQRLQQGVA